MRKRIIASLLILVLTLSFCFALSSCVSIKPTIDRYTIDKEELTVGVFSDIQMQGSGDIKNSAYAKSLKSSLTTMKDNAVDVLIFGGDLTDLATKDAYEAYEDIYDSVFTDTQPIKSFIMGNHDYWLDMFFKSWEIPTKSKMQKRFAKAVNESPWTHKVVNGYHFIGFSPVNGKMGDGAYDKKLEWAEDAIKTAVAEDPNKPIFVTTHHNPANTMYGSEDWGIKELDNLFKKYPQVVSLSGHTHYSLLDERSIMQTSYTAISTQSVSYTDFESGKMPIDGLDSKDDNGRTNIEDNPMGLIMKIKGNTVTIDRVGMLDNKKQKDSWVLDFPLTDANKKYTADRANNNEAPRFVNSNPTLTKKDEILSVKFIQATDDDFTFAYSVKLKDKEGNLIKYNDKEEILFFSDFYRGLNKMSNYFTINLLKVPESVYSIEISAIDSWGAKSAPMIIGQKTI